MSATGFSRGATITVVGIIGGSFIFMLLVLVFSADRVEPSAGTNSYSRSALGHNLLVETLRELGHEVSVGRLDPPRRDISNDLVIYAEPDPFFLPEEDELEAIVQRAGAVLLILPKRTAIKDRREEDRVARSEADEYWRARSVLESFLPGLDLVTTSDEELEPDGWKSTISPVLPEIDDVRLVRDQTAISPLVWNDEFVLFGLVERPWQDVFLASDPDIFATHGFVKGENADLAVQIIRHCLPEGGSIIFDEVGHGYAVSNSFWQMMFEYPMSLATVHGLLVLLVLLWATLGRLGKERALPPAITPGKRFLLDNVVSLLTFYKHHAHLGSRYLDSTIRRTAARLKVRGTRDEIEERLERMSRARGVTWNPADWREQLRAGERRRGMASKSVLNVARDIDRWKKEMLDGS